MSDVFMSASSGDEEPVFECRGCPGRQFRESEKEAHLAQHKRDQQVSEDRERRSPSSTTFRLFRPIGLYPSSLSSTNKEVKRKEDVAKRKEYRKKNKSVKKFDQNYEQKRVHSG